MKIQYANWIDAAPLNLSLKDALKLAKQLKTYVNSTKFVRDGAKVNTVDNLGVLKKAPVKNVTYYTDADGSNPMSALDLEDFIRTAIINKDPLMLQHASLYRFYKSNRLKTAKLLAQLKIADHRKRLARNATILGTTLGAAGAALPIADRLTAGNSVDQKTLKSAMLLALAGIGSGITIAGLTTKY